MVMVSFKTFSQTMQTVISWLNATGRFMIMVMVVVVALVKQQ
jgi:hypothetical protein